MYENLIGKKFNKLVVISYDTQKNNRNYWICKCDCGNIKSVSTGNLKSNNVKSCGCLKNGLCLIGKKYERLSVIKYAHKIKNVLYWECLCDCGKIHIASGTGLRSGLIKSCGCLRLESITKHGLNNTKLYAVHQSMKDRCLKINHKSYKDYGGRGITVCDEWLGENGFVSFYNWAIANGYRDELNESGKRNKLSIDRINNNLSYSPNNCQWITHSQQSNNKRNSKSNDNRLIIYNGETKTAREWRKILGL